MSLVPGVLVGSYEVVSLLGAGGMGEVYRARDTRLQRDVALKILPDVFANDRERLARFEREAQVLASLNHPHIAAIYGVEHREGLQALVLELVEGPTLADRIAQGPMPLDEALPIARQIAEALEAAHEHGIIHRDLKPANVKLRPDGAVKVLDFGLAKAGATSAAGAAGAVGPLPDYPTITSPAMMTGAGVILGTAAYMSPEQAKGKVADRRSDLWAFGCVLFEMLTGTRAFEGEDVSDTLASVLRAEPKWSVLPPETPEALRRLLRRSLEKDCSRRLSDIGVARLEIDEALTTPAVSREAPAGAAVVPPRPWWKRAIPLALTAIVVGALGATAGWMLKPAPPLAIARSRFMLPGTQIFGPSGRQAIAISPDGTHVAYIVDNRLYLRAMAELEPRVVPGSDTLGGNLSHPVFSPDGASIAFFSFLAGGSGFLHRIAATGGTPLTVCAVRSTNFGLSWDRSGIVFGEGPRGIFRVSPNGGQPEMIVAVEAGEEASFPQVLPDSEMMLFTIATGSPDDRWDSARIVVQRIGSSDRKTLVEGGSHARYVRTGHLVYALGGTLLALPFDAAKLTTSGGPTPVVEGIRRGALGTAFFSVSDTGSLMLVPGPAGAMSLRRRDLVMIDRQGRVESLKLPPGGYTTPRISPDAHQLAFGIESGQEADVWIYSLSGAGTMQRLTFGGRNRFPIWSSDGQRVAFQSDREGDLGIYWQRVDTPGAAERLTKAEQGVEHVPESWSRNGERFSFSAVSNSGASLWAFSVTEKKASAFGDIRSATPLNSTFSPDGRWIAYTLRTAAGGGDAVVFVEPVPPTGAKFQITKDSSHHPVWSSPDARELSYRVGATQQMVVSIATQPKFSASNPLPLPGEYALIPFGTPANYDVMPDGKRFVMTAPTARGDSDLTSQREIHIVVNWFEELKRRVPADR